MSTEYTGVATYPLTITIPDGSDADDAASAAVALMQLADRCEAIRAGHDLVFYDATFHGASNFADGSIDANVDRMNLNATNNVDIEAFTDFIIRAGQNFSLQANQDANLAILRDLSIAVTRNLTVTIGGGASINPTGPLGLGGSYIDLMGGVATFSPAGIGLGSSTSTPTEVRGQLTAQHNATFIAGKTVALNGTTTAADLTASALKGTVSSSTGVTYSGTGRAHYRDREITEAELAAAESLGGNYAIHPDNGDFFYITVLTGHHTAALNSGDTSIVGDVIEISLVGMTGNFRLDIYNQIGTLLLSMTNSTRSWSRWKRMAGGPWRLIGVSNS